MQALPPNNALATTTGAPLNTAESILQERQRDIGYIWRILYRRRWAALGIFAGFVLLVVLGTLVWPKQYMSDVKLIAGTSSSGPTEANPDVGLPVLNALMIASGMQSAETYAELFQETPVLDKVIQSEKLAISPHNFLKDHVVVKPVTNTNIVDIGVTWGNRVKSAAIANAFAQAIVDRQRELVSAQARMAVDSLKQQLPQAQASMNDAAEKLARFEATNHIADINQQTQVTIQNMAAIESKIGQVRADRQQAQAQLSSAQGQLSTLTPTITGMTQVNENPVLANLQQQLSQVDVQLRQAQEQYTDVYPQVIALKQQKAEIEKAIQAQQSTIVAGRNVVPNPVYQTLQQQAAGYRSQVAADDAQVTELSRQEKAMNPELAALPAQTEQLARLQLQAKATQDVYTQLQQKFVNAQVASETAISDVTITQPADPRTAQEIPNLLLNTVIAVVLGLVLGVTGALVLDYFDNRIRDERETEVVLGLPTLGTVPLVELRNGEAAQQWVKTLAMESFIQLITNVRYASDVKMRSLAILSPMQGDGKSTCAINIALAMKEIEGPVLLVDADMRRPSLHAKMHLRNDRGLSDVLVGLTPLLQAVQVDERSGLSVMTSGTPAPNPVKLLESRSFDSLIEEALKSFQMIIFDGAAFVGNIDSAVLARKSDGSLLIVSQGKTDMREANRTLKRLRRMGVNNVLGFVLNRVQARRSDYDAYSSYQIPVESDDSPIVAATGN